MADVNSLSLIVNVQDSDKSGILDSFTTNFPGSIPRLIRNDTVALTLRLVKPSSISGQAWDDVDYSSASVTVGLGEFDKVPTAGAFSLTYGANTASGIVPSVTAATLQTTLNALASVTSAGGVVVTSPQAGIFIVTFNNVGVRTLISSTNTLYPASHVVISQVVAGTASVAEVQVIQLIVDPYALNTTWSSFSGASATISSIAAGSSTTQNVQSITLSPVPYAGTFQITTSTSTTAAIQYNASAQDVQDAMGGSSIYTVTGSAGGPWTVTTVANGVGTAYSVNTSGLKVPVGLSGSLNLSTYGMLNRFIGETSDSITLKLEIQITPSGGSPGTILQVPVTVSKDVINYSALVPTPIPNYYTASQCDSFFVHLTGNETISGSKTFTGSANTVLTASPLTNSKVIANTEYADAADIASKAALIEREGLRFDGTAGAVIGNGGIPAVGTGDFTLAFMLNYSSLGSSSQGTILGGAPSSTDLTIRFNGSLWIVGSTLAESYIVDPVAPNTPMLVVIVKLNDIYYAYRNGVLVGSIVNGSALTSPYYINYIIGGAAYSANSNIARLKFFNYALTQSEITALIGRGLVTLPEQRGGSMTALNTSAFSSAGYETFTGASATGFSAVNTASDGMAWSGPSLTLTVGRRYAAIFTATLNSGVLPVVRLGIPGGTNCSSNTNVLAGANRIELTVTTGAAGASLIFNSPSNGDFVISGVQFIPLGTLFEQDSGQRNAGYMVRDTSGNSAHLELPASGVSIIDPAETGVIRYTRASDGFIIGDRVIIPTGYVIDFIMMRTVSGTCTAYMGSTAGASDIVTSQSLTTAWTSILDPVESSTGKVHLTRSTGSVQVQIAIRLA